MAAPHQGTIGVDINGPMDAKANVIETVAKWCVHLINSGSLLACMSENVKGILARQNGNKSYMQTLKEALEKAAPSFHWDIVTLHTGSYQLPHIRERGWLRGMHQALGAKIPEPLAPFGKTLLHNFLNPNIPNIHRSALPENKARNLRDYEIKIRVLLKHGKVEEDDITVVSIDRAVDKLWSAPLLRNAVPTLTTHNGWLFLLSCDVVKPDADRKFFRFLHAAERLPLHGFSPGIAKLLPSANMCVKAAGNAYAASTLGAAMAPILSLIADKYPNGAPELPLTAQPTPATKVFGINKQCCLLYTSPSPRDS